MACTIMAQQRNLRNMNCAVPTVVAEKLLPSLRTNLRRRQKRYASHAQSTARSAQVGRVQCSQQSTTTT